MEPLTALIIAAALSVWAGGGYISGTGQGGRIVMIVLSAALLLVAYLALTFRVLATW
jgi:hypothetical protein